MRKTIEIFVPGLPKATGRPRAFARKFGQKYQARVYNPATAEAWKGDIAIAVRDLRPETPHIGPVMLDLTFFFPRPKGHFGNGKNADKLKDWAPLRHLSKPDRDNLDKSVLDCLKTLGFFKDDSQVCAGAIAKFYVTPGIDQTGFDENRPGMLMELAFISEDENRASLATAGVER